MPVPTPRRRTSPFATSPFATSPFATSPFARLRLAPPSIASSMTSWMLALSAVASPALHAQPAPATDPAPVSGGTAAGQVALGTLGTAAGFVGGGLATRWVARRAGGTPDQASRAAYVGAWTTAALATPIAPVLLGSRDGVRGSYPAAVGGTLAGGAASLLIVTAGRRGAFDCRACAPVRLLAAVSAFVLPSLGATIAFNASREMR